MNEKLKEFDLLLNRFAVLYATNNCKDFENKPTENKWSKKEILGHLIDSAINNMQRFTEIQYFEKPYQIKQYNPDELVKANDYQNKKNQEIYDLWLHLNEHISHIVKNQTPETLQYSIVLPNGELSDLNFLINDYFDHFYYHINQINPEWT